MEIICNENHTIFDIFPNANYSYNRYKIFEYCPIVKYKEEVLHPSGKRAILEKYKLDKKN